MHKVSPSTTLYYKLFTKHFPVLLCTTKLAQSTSSTTLYYKACTKSVPVLLCTTQLAQSTSQYYFVLHRLHKVSPISTSYYKACTKNFPVLLCTTMLTQYTFHLLTYHYRSLDLATPLRFTMSSCTRHNSIAHAGMAFMQPVQCALHHDVAKTHLSMHMATQNDNNHAATTMRSANREWTNAKNYAHMNNHSLQMQWRNRLLNYASNRAQPHPPHTRGTFHRRCSHFTWKNTRFHAPAFPPIQATCNIHAASTMRLAPSCSKDASLYAHGNTK